MDVRPGPEDASTSRTQPRYDRFPAAPRVSQVDTEELDEGLVGMLAEKVERSIGNFRSNLGADLKPEIHLILKLVIFRLSFFGLTQASPGAKLQNLKLIHEFADRGSAKATRRSIILYLLLHPPIFPSYILTRLRDRALSQQWPDLPSYDWRRKAWKVILRLEDAARLWELAGWAWFLWDGLYPSLVTRILRLRLVAASPHLQRLVSYEFMNRQLVWSAFTEFMMFSVPLLPSVPASLSPRHLAAPIAAFLSRPKDIDYASIPLLPSSISSAGSNGKSSQKAHTGPLADLPLTTCPICHLRQTSSPVPLDSVGAGSGISLPRISGSGQGEPKSMSQGDDETRIFVPAQTDCWGGCRCCYYCIGEELYKHAEGVKERLAKARPVEGTKKGQEGQKSGEVNQTIAPSDEKHPWECLRCGGSVTRAWRVGAEDAT